MSHQLYVNRTPLSGFWICLHFPWHFSYFQNDINNRKIKSELFFFFFPCFFIFLKLFLDLKKYRTVVPPKPFPGKDWSRLMFLINSILSLRKNYFLCVCVWKFIRGLNQQIQHGFDFVLSCYKDWQATLTTESKAVVMKVFFQLPALQGYLHVRRFLCQSYRILNMNVISSICKILTNCILKL